MTHPRRFEVLALAGSLRRASFNRQLLNAAAARAPAGLSISVYDDLRSVPLFDEDLEVHGGPDPVARLRAAVARSDALLISTPEYNQSLPGVVKNLVDWLSRSEPDLLTGKPIGILGVTAGPWGTRLAQAALRHTLTACGSLVMPMPQLYLADGGGMFKPAGELADEHVCLRMVGYLEKLQAWIQECGTANGKADEKRNTGVR